MIRHIVVWRLKPEVRQGGSIQNLERIHAVLAALRAGVPGLQRLELGVNEAKSADAGDLVMISEFDSWEALRGYEGHELHDQLRALIGPMRIERRVVDYEV